MSVTAKDFLESAIELDGRGVDEMTRRNVVSRAYYAAYHQASEFVPPIRNEENDNVGVHRAYITQLIRGAHGSIERSIGKTIQSMYTRRRKADYKLEQHLKLDEGELQIIAAKDLFVEIENAKANPTITANSNASSAQGKPKLRIIK